jgi:polysaccharide biosynthesis/export protein
VQSEVHDWRIRMMRWVIASLVLELATGSARAGYRLQPGDQIEVVVIGFADLRRSFAIDSDGQVAVPLVGPLTAKGRTIDELRKLIQKALEQQVFTNHTTSGDAVVRISPEQVSVDVVQYRPVYIRGDVAAPGEQPYRPGMTIRQLVAKAGGIGIPFFERGPNSPDPKEVEARYTAQLQEVQNLEAVQNKIEAALAEPEKSGTAELPAGSDVVVARVKLLQQERRTLDNQTTYLKTAIEKAKDRIAILNSQIIAQIETVKGDELDLKKATDNLNAGTVTADKVFDRRRQLAVSVTSLGETKDVLNTVEARVLEFERGIQNAAELYRAALLQELQKVVADRTAAVTQLQVLSDQLSADRASAAESGSGAKFVKFQLFQDTDGSPAPTKEVGQEYALQPGDVVEVTVQRPFPGGGLRVLAGQ